MRTCLLLPCIWDTRICRLVRPCRWRVASNPVVRGRSVRIRRGGVSLLGRGGSLRLGRMSISNMNMFFRVVNVLGRMVMRRGRVYVKYVDGEVCTCISYIAGRRVGSRLNQPFETQQRHNPFHPVSHTSPLYLPLITIQTHCRGTLLYA